MIVSRVELNGVDEIKRSYKLSMPETVEQQMTFKYPSILTQALGCIKHYKIPRMKFKGEVPRDGGRQVDSKERPNLLQKER